MTIKPEFNPWVGSRYWGKNKLGARVLVLGESHYGKAKEKKLDFTIEVVQKYAQNERYSFFTKISKLLLNLGVGENPSMFDRGDVWEDIAFYNYIQSLVGAGPRKNPEKHEWENAKIPFQCVVQNIKPQLVLVLGFNLYSHIPSLPENVEVCRVKHPSSSFSYKEWNPVFIKALQRVCCDG